MQPQTIPCPNVGHLSFQKKLREIVIGDAKTTEQISKFIPPLNDLVAGFGGALSPIDLSKRIEKEIRVFDHQHFIKQVISKNQKIFRNTECRIYQFQVIQPSGSKYIFGVFVTDGFNNLVDFCLETKQADKRKPILMGLIRAICTPVSVQNRLFH